MFHTLDFWLLFILLLPILGIVRRRRVLMVAFVTAFSLYFYWRASGRFVLLLAGTAVMDYALSHYIHSAKSKTLRMGLLALSLCFSVGLLAYFKYADFFLWNWNWLVGSNFSPLSLILPLGISYYTFQSVSYVVDVYRKKVVPARSLLDYLFFLSFFPAILAGPIMRASKFFPQLYVGGKNIQAHAIYNSLFLILVGIVKKVVIADYLAQYTDIVFSLPQACTGFASLMGIAGYTMQIYLDFSGYSDMAIGIAGLMGFDIGINFEYPYKSRSITDFWRRWHISLSSWLRDYVYIPLGGNRCRKWRIYVNNLLTMLFAGLWHGAAWRFVLWGGMHGMGLVIHKAFKPWLDKMPDIWPVKAVSWFVTISYVSMLWILFRVDDWSDSLILLKSVFCDFNLFEIPGFVINRFLWLMILAVSILFQCLPSSVSRLAMDCFTRSPWIAKLAAMLAVMALVAVMGSQQVRPFIYTGF